jgi:cytosine/adenosine deaminase-related metal-dependent hydrolase
MIEQANQRCATARRRHGGRTRAMRRWALLALVFISVGSYFAAPARASLLVRNATFLTMKAGENTPVVGYMLVDDNGIIAALGPGTPPAGTRASANLDASGKIIIRGFVSAYSHAWQGAFRGLATDQFTPGWLVVMRQYSTPATDADVYWFTLDGALDHLRHGITALFDFGYNSRFGEYNKEHLQGLLDSRMRFVPGFAQLRAAPIEDQYQSFRRFYDFAKPHLSNPKFLRLGTTGSRDPLELVKLDKRLMDEFGVLNQAHYLEEPIDKEQQQKLFQNFIDAGTLGPNQFFGHFIHTNDDILRKTAAAGSGMSWQPLSAGRMASGIADIPKYLAMGVKVGMGVDGQASADVADPFENMRMGLYLLRAKSENATIMAPIDVLRLHTRGSAEVMGLADKIGSLEPGKFADFLVIKPLVPVFDAAATVVFATSGEDVEAVYVGGEKLVDHMRLTRADAARVSREIASRVGRIRASVQPK